MDVGVEAREEVDARGLRTHLSASDTAAGEERTQQDAWPARKCASVPGQDPLRPGQLQLQTTRVLALESEEGVLELQAARRVGLGRRWRGSQLAEKGKEGCPTPLLDEVLLSAGGPTRPAAVHSASGRLHQLQSLPPRREKNSRHLPHIRPYRSHPLQCIPLLLSLRGAQPPQHDQQLRQR